MTTATRAPSHWAIMTYNNAYNRAQLAEGRAHRLRARARRTNDPHDLAAADSAAETLTEARDELAAALADLSPEE